MGWQMKVNDHQFIVNVDIDGTLVKRVHNKEESRVKITNPYDKKTYMYAIHDENIELLRMYKGRGFYIKAWSANGSGHAATVVRALGLGDQGGDGTVDECETKPMKHMDDRTAVDAVVGPRVFIPKEGWEER